MPLPDIHRSARKHYAKDHLGDEDLRHAYGHVLNSRPLDDEDDPRRWLVLGVDESGRVLELVVLVFGLFVFEGVVGGAYCLVEVVAVRWSLRRPVWMRLRMV